MNIGQYLVIIVFIVHYIIFHELKNLQYFSGECPLNKGNHYSLLAKLNYMTKYKKSFRTTFLKVMEGWHEDLSEELQTDISTCFNQDGTAKSAQGHIASDILAKKEQNYLLHLMCPFSAISNLIPSGIDIGNLNSKLVLIMITYYE